MLADGVYVIAFSFPVVPRGQARIRVQLSAAHSEDDVRRCVEAFVARPPQLTGKAQVGPRVVPGRARTLVVQGERPHEAASPTTVEQEQPRERQVAAHRPDPGHPTGTNPEKYAGEEAEAGVGDAPQVAPQPVPITAHPAGDPTAGDPTTAAGTASWAGRLGLRGDGAGPTPWARRIGLAGAAAALVAVGGVGGYAVGNAVDDGGDRFSPTSFQFDGEGDGDLPASRHGRDGQRPPGFDDEGLDGEGFGRPGGDGQLPQAPGDDAQPDTTDTTGTTATIT